MDTPKVRGDVSPKTGNLLFGRLILLVIVDHFSLVVARGSCLDAVGHHAGHVLAMCR